MTVIYSNAGDVDCELLRNLWKGIEDVNVVEINWDGFDCCNIETVNAAISQEDDFLLFCGHGQPEGLFGPFHGGLAFGKHNLHLVHARQVLCVWCYAADFCRDNHLAALASSMFISNTDEAYYNCINGESQEQINETNIRIYTEMNALIREGLHISEWCDPLLATLDRSNKIDEFNRGGMIYLEDTGIKR